MPRVLFLIFSVAITIFAVAEIASTRPDRFPSGQFPGGIPKAYWILFSIILPPFGGLAWLVISRVQLADENGFSLGEIFQGKKRASRSASHGDPVAPDDDPEFLWKLEKELYKRRKEARAASEQTDAAASGELQIPKLDSQDSNSDEQDSKSKDKGEGHADDDSSDAAR
ncbi:PLDc N-terminal domain-containing protein [Gleimia sp. 6138-11-ORH1]|uniref:PLD nuclease N-terminal domain-containing protein n=1 Tax=Gleimia sp. 6138-11-ORH1 TaxID=2973937 RepID=UPI002169F2EB|nr:PLDc N-terminal domain-containing protein [Gleimia sp. 6138-11-ORH1]MCS4483881.1 PLDc N-terminal domain-containing protein [Gleimia sp. 6138-11-ORH1]